MFQSYEYIKYLGYDAETKQRSYQYKIIDSDFEEVAVAVAVGVGVGVGVAVIRVYEKRNLNVAANLIAAILYIHKRYPVYSIQHIIEDNHKYNHKFAQYEKEVSKRLEKLLPLL
jgi:hypothetical protein